MSADVVAQALTVVSALWYDRIYTPLVTRWVFLGQVRPRNEIGHPIPKIGWPSLPSG